MRDAEKTKMKNNNELQKMYYEKKPTNQSTNEK